MEKTEHNLSFHIRLREIFDKAIEISNVANRKSYVDSACQNDNELKRLVGRLLQSHESAGSYLERPFDPSAQAIVSHLRPLDETNSDFATISDTAVAPSIGDQVGAYVLEEQIGEGGFGVVFSGIHRDIANRKVAIKVLKPEMDTRHVIARFNRERLSLSVMNHAGIARIYEAGSTGHGLPYFIMELVSGPNITQYCDHHTLTIKQRIELILVVCNSIAHAHLKGVIHRDLKPGNVLVENIDGSAMPKVIDFGISRTSELVCDDPRETGNAQLMGTPLYMSPEQASFDNYDIDVRTDVYSLGILLFELLSGSPPAIEPDDEASNVGLILQRTRNGFNTSIRQRLNSLDISSRKETSLKRATSFEKLIHSISNDLESVVAKAIETERDLRYESVSALADDLENIINNTPVEARPASLVYRSRKFCQRNRTRVILASSSFAVLLAATFFSIWFVVRAHHAEFIAKTAIAAEQLAVTSEKRAIDAKQEEAEAKEQALAFLTNFLESASVKNHGPDVTFAEVVLGESELIAQAFPDNPKIRTKLLEKARTLFSHHSRGDEAARMSEEKLNILARSLDPGHIATLEAKQSLANELLIQGQSQRSMAIAQEIAEAVSDKSSKRATSLRCRNLTLLARIHRSLGQIEDAISKSQQVDSLGTEILGKQDLLVLQNSAMLVHLYLSLKRFTDAEKQLQQSLASAREAFPMDHPVNISFLAASSSINLEKGNVEQSLKDSNSAVHYSGIRDGHNHIIFAQHLRFNAKVQLRAGNLDKALTQIQRAVEILEAERNVDLVTAYRTMGRIWSARGNKEQEIQCLEEAFSISSQKLPPNSANNLHLEARLAFLKKDQDLETSVSRMEMIVDRMKKYLGKQYYGTIDTMATLSCMYTRQQRYEKVENVLSEALKYSRKLDDGSDSPTLAILALYAESLKQQGKSDLCYSTIQSMAPHVVDNNSPQTSTEKQLLAIYQWASEKTSLIEFENDAFGPAISLGEHR